MWSIPVICRYFLLFQGSSLFVRICLQYFFGKGRQWKGCMKKALPWESWRRKLSFPRREDRKRNLIRRFGDLCLRFCFVYFLLYGIQCSNLCIQQICQPGGRAGGGSFANFQFVATMVTLVSYMPMANLSCRIGRKVTTYIGIGLMCL